VTEDVAPSYRALALQLRCRSLIEVTGRDEARASMLAAVDHVRRAVAASLAFIGPDCTLVVLPEYALTGHPLGEAPEAWAARAAIDVDGPEVEGLASIAADHGIYLTVNAYERDKAFPDLFFQGQFVLGPAGEVVLRYRRLFSLLTPTPYDVLDAYLDRYGIDGLLPVARTEIGALACLASEEILFPELARALALRGAEVFLHSTSEASSPRLMPKDVARRARAIENLAYVVSANSGGIEGSPIPSGSTDGGSQIVDFDGRVLVRAGAGESMVANARLDVDALRRERRRPGMANLLARNRFGLFSETLAGAPVQPPNGLTARAPDRAWFMAQHHGVIESLSDKGII